MEFDGRLKKNPAPELVQSANWLETGYGPLFFNSMNLADMAHVTMLAEIGIIPTQAARKLQAVLLQLYRMPAEQFHFDPLAGDAYKNRERYIVGLEPEAGGWLRAGRARREATNIAYQLVVRDRLLELIAALAGLADALTSLAEKHTGTLMPDFTYLQHAQPTTLAHYLLSFVFPILRDFERLQACFRRVNQCPGGIGSVNGSRLPFRRQRLAELLGFQGVITNTRDAMWQADMPVEIMAGVVAALLSMDRLGEDLQVWATQEFNLIELADEYCRESVIMPQKKNPYGLTFIRGASGVLIGRMAAMANVGRTMSGQPDNRIFAYGEIPASIDLACRSVRLMAGIVRTLSVNEAGMASQAGQGYSQATDLAEVIMLEANLPYLAAHRLVAEVVSAAAQKGWPAERISSRLIDATARRVLGMSVKLPPEAIQRANQPAEIVATRTGLGGAALEPVRQMIMEARRSISEIRDWQVQSAASLENAEASLIQLATGVEGMKEGGTG
jgi:argininosuccinate lyase